jgi:hypothetical protein
MSCIDRSPRWLLPVLLGLPACQGPTGTTPSSSQCADGPLFEYRVGTTVRRFRIDRIVRLRGGAWKIFDARM